MPLDWQGLWDQPGLDTEFKNDVQALLGPDPDAWRVTYAVRTHDEQAALYAKYEAGGAKAAKPGHSPHEYGLAVDITRLQGTGITAKERWDYDNPAWKRVWDGCDASPRLHTGHHFDDDDHIEATKFQKVKAAKEADGTW